MGAKQKVKQAKSSQRENARRAEELKALFEQAEPQPKQAEPRREPAAVSQMTSSYATPTPTLTELTESQRRIQQAELTRTMTTSPTVSQSRPREATSLRTVIAHQPYSPARRLDQPAVVSPKVEKAESEPNRGLGVILLLAAALLGFIGYWNVQYSQKHAVVRAKPVASQTGATAEDRTRVDFYRQQLGHRLNQQRVDVEIQNYTRAPSLSVADRPGAHAPNMMMGLPLAPQTVENSTGVYSSRFRTTPISPDHPDARIQYGLQEEEHRDEYTRQVNKDYVEEFVRNAQREGLKVEIDSNYNVIDIKRNGSSLMRNPGSEQGPAR